MNEDNRPKVQADGTSGDELLSNDGHRSPGSKDDLQKNNPTRLCSQFYPAYYPRPGPRSKMTGKHFGGLSQLGNGHIARSYLMTENLACINTDDQVQPDFATSYPGGIPQACSEITARFAAVAGRIYITICRCDDASLRHGQSSDYQGTNHEVVSHSGFWAGPRFITCAHFLDIYHGTEEQNNNTIELLKKKEFSMVNLTKSVVSSKTMVSRGTPVDGIAVYLEKLDRNADLAVFVRYENNGFNQGTVTGVQDTDIVTFDSVDTSQGIYTIGYYSKDEPIGNLNTYDHEIADRFWTSKGDAKPQTYFPIKYAGFMQDRNDEVKFEQVFQFPDFRTISLGRIAQLYKDNGRSITMLCELSAWFGSSGGLVGGFTRREVGGQTQLEPVIFGLLQGDEGSKTTIVAFTESGKDWLLN